MSSLLLAFVLLLGPAFSADGDYFQNGADWSGECSTGQNQSPVDIKSFVNVDSSDGYSTLSIGLESMATYNKIVSGKTYKYEGKHSTLTAVDIAKVSYVTQGTSISVHAPSEHYLNGHQYPMEMHIQYEPATPTASDPYAYTIIVVFFEEGEESVFLSGIIDPNPIAINLYPLFLGVTLTNYYMYKGSKTSFPCQETAQYYVLGDVRTASAAQLKVFTDLWASDPLFAGGKGNNRALQSMIGREMLRFKEPPTCFAGCAQCVGPSQAACIDNADQVAFVNIAEADYSLPLLHETDGKFCFYQRIPDSSCDPLSTLTSAVTKDAAGLHPTLDQCYDILKGSWPGVDFWFEKLFPNFSPPTMPPPTTEEVHKLKSVLWLWILRYGPSVLSADPLWQDIVATFNNASPDWSILLAWKGTLTGYTTDGSTIKSFPAELEAALTPTSPELQLFNHFSTLCNSACALGVQCQQLSTSNVCGR